jgi:hypothetical protein
VTHFLLRCARNHRRAPDPKPEYPQSPYATNEQLNEAWRRLEEWKRREAPRQYRRERRTRLQLVRAK